MYEVKAITVKKWMTKKSVEGFDFMQKFNNNVPMPFLKMAGFKLKETPKMVYMRCRGEIFSTTTEYCVKCGKPITNPISQYFGLGPICGNHDYTNPFASNEELLEAVNKYREETLHKTIWEGWIPKSAIICEEPMN